MHHLAPPTATDLSDLSKYEEALKNVEEKIGDVRSPDGAKMPEGKLAISATTPFLEPQPAGRSYTVSYHGPLRLRNPIDDASRPMRKESERDDIHPQQRYVANRILDRISDFILTGKDGTKGIKDFKKAHLMFFVPLALPPPQLTFSRRFQAFLFDCKQLKESKICMAAISTLMLTLTMSSPTSLGRRGI